MSADQENITIAAREYRTPFVLLSLTEEGLMATRAIDAESPDPRTVQRRSPQLAFFNILGAHAHTH